MQAIELTTQAISTPTTPTDAELTSYFFAMLDASEKTKQTYETNLKPWFKFMHLTGVSLVTATKAHAVQYKQQLKAAGRKANTINAYLSALRALYKLLASENITSDITSTLKNERTQSASAKQSLTVQQTQMLLEPPKVGASIEQLRNYALINLCVRRGLRTCELQRANISDIQAQGGKSVLYVQGKGKTDKCEFVVLSHEVLAPIMRYLNARNKTDAAAPLFAGHGNRNKGGRMSTRSISRIIKDALRAQGLNNASLTAHSLRHTAVTLSLLGGASLQETQQLARHASINTTLIYAHNLSRLEGKAESAIDNLLSA